MTAHEEDYGPVLDRLDQDHRREVDVEVRSISRRGCCYGRRKACGMVSFALLAMVVAVYVLFGKEMQVSHRSSSEFAAAAANEEFSAIEDEAKKEKEEKKSHKKDEYEDEEEEEEEEEEELEEEVEELEELEVEIEEIEEIKEKKHKKHGEDLEVGEMLDEGTFDAGGKDDSPGDDVGVDLIGCKGDKMESEVPLNTGEFLCAKHGLYKFGMNDDGDLVWIDVAKNETLTYRTGKPGYQFVLRDDGRFNVYNKHGEKRWEKECMESVHYKKECSNGHNCPFLHMHGDGLVLLNWVGEESEIGEVEEDGEVLEYVGELMEKRIQKLYEF